MSDKNKVIHPCPMCDAGDIGRSVSRDILYGKKTPQQAMLQFKMTLKDVMEHVNEHEIVVDEETGKYESPDFFMNEFLKMFKMCKDWLSYCVKSEKVSKTDMDMAIKLVREMRETLKCLAEMKGKMGGSSNIEVNVDIVNQKYIYMTNRIITEVCPKCQLKIINLMDEMQEEPIKTISNT